MPSYRRQQAGRRTKAQGDAFEAALERWHNLYRQRGEACIEHAGPPVRIRRMNRDDSFTGFYASKGPADYVGVLYSGRGFAAEAKSVTLKKGKRSWALAEIKPHQAKRLDGVEACRGVAVVFLRVLDGNRVQDWVLPWLVIGPLWWRWHDHGGSPASLNKDDIAECGVPFDPRRGWLPAVMSLLGESPSADMETR